MVPPPSKNTVGVSNQITLIILYYTSFRLVTLLKDIDAPIQVSDILGLTISLKFIKFSFQLLLLFFLVSTSFPRKNKYCKRHIQTNSLFMSNFIISVRRGKLKNAHNLRRNSTVKKKTQWVAGVHTVWTHFLALLRFCQHSHTFNITDVCAHQKTHKVHFTATENNSTEHYGTHYECDTNLNETVIWQ